MIPSSHKWNNIGRKKLPEGEALTCLFSTMVSESENTAFRGAAHAHGLKPSELLRAILRDWMAKQ